MTRRDVVGMCSGVLLLLAGCGDSQERPGPAAVRPSSPPAAGPPAALDALANPPPLSGGTLAVTRDGATAVVADPDTDRVLLVDLARRRVSAAFQLARGDEPGRVVIDEGPRAHVVLRGAGAVVTVDLATQTLGARRAVCPIPRGIAWDGAADALHVACLGGELVTLPAAGGEATRRVALDRDLRDVVVQGNRLLVTRFRAAETLVVDERGVVVQRLATPVGAGQSTAAVAWRAAPLPRGGFWLLHQRVGTAPVRVTTVNGYYRTEEVTIPCDGTQGITRPGLTLIQPPYDPVVLPDVPFSPLTVDVAVSPDGARVALANAGNVGAPSRPQLVEAPTTSTTTCLSMRSTPQPPRGQVTAVAYAPSGELLAQTRAPATLFAPGSGEAIALGGPAEDDPGHRLFHTNPTGLMACASCHAEGDDDGRAWNFAPIGPRRTQPLRGGLLGTEPFHWNGDLQNFQSLIREVMVRRMAAPEPPEADVARMAAWLDRLPVRPRPAADAAAVARGEALFRDTTTACATCHGGPAFTNNQTVDVGTRGRFQVPTLLGLAWRAPYLHDGCAPTLRERFTDARCGGGDAHGRTSHLTPAQVGDLVAYLETL